jgi:hypothetical protein
MKAVWSKAETKFRASQKKDEKFLKDKENSRKESAQKLARLRALRMEKENSQ